jgi:hypothetical protein
MTGTLRSVPDLVGRVHGQFGSWGVTSIGFGQRAFRTIGRGLILAGKARALPLGDAHLGKTAFKGCTLPYSMAVVLTKPH